MCGKSITSVFTSKNKYLNAISDVKQGDSNREGNKPLISVQ